MRVNDPPKISRANLDDGTAHAERCHGGTPRAGAPKGNCNAVKHGAFAEGGRRKPPRKARDEALMREIGEWVRDHPLKATVASSAEQQRGRELATTLRGLATHLNKTLQLKKRLGRASHSALLARHDVLELLLSALSSFDGEIAFRCAVACIFLGAL